MFKVFRFFSKYAKIEELGKFPPEIQKHLTVLGSIETYRSFMGHKPVVTLDLLCKSSKKKLNTSLIEWQKFPEIKVLLEHLPQQINSYSLENLILIVKSVSDLNIHDKKIWEALEQTILSKIDGLKERQLYDVLSRFSRHKSTSRKLWLELERVISNNFCPRHNIRGLVVAQIISTYDRLGLLNPRFLLILEQQILRTFLDIDGTSTVKILDVFYRNNIGSEELYKCLCKNAMLILSKLDWYSTTILLMNFVRLGKGSDCDKIEEQFLLHENSHSFKNFADVLYTYAKFIPGPVRDNTKRRKFLDEVCGILAKKKESIQLETSQQLILYAIYGMTIGRFFNHKHLWEMLFEKLKSTGEIKDKENKKLFATIQSILSESEIKNDS